MVKNGRLSGYIINYITGQENEHPREAVTVKEYQINHEGRGEMGSLG